VNLLREKKRKKFEIDNHQAFSALVATMVNNRKHSVFSFQQIAESQYLRFDSW